MSRRHKTGVTSSCHAEPLAALLFLALGCFKAESLPVVQLSL